MGNSLELNPPDADYNLTLGGSDWLWTAFCLFAVSTLVMVVLNFMRPRGTRLFHQIAIIVLATSTISYFSMASDLGAAAVQVEWNGTGTRQIWYVRYIQWFITFPLLLLELLLATGLSLSDIMTTLYMAIFLVVTHLVGALVQSDYKWGYFTFGCASLLYVWYVLLWHAPHATFASGSALRSGYLVSAGYFSFMLVTYPIAWACTEGANIVSVTREMVWYGILDLFIGPVFLFLFLWELRSVDYAAFGLQSGKYTDRGAANLEKGLPPAASGAAPVTQ